MTRRCNGSSISMAKSWKSVVVIGLSSARGASRRRRPSHRALITPCLCSARTESGLSATTMRTPFPPGVRRRGKNARGDHRHERSRAKPYDYADAETLVQDFWADVERVLKSEGIP